MASHYVFQNNPTELKGYVYKHVSVHYHDGISQEGWVHTIDPVSGSIVLVTVENDKCSKLNIILGHAIRSITVINDDVNIYKKQLDDLGTQSQPTFSDADIDKRKERTKLWLKKNRIPFEDNDGQLNIMDALILDPPYGPSNCISANTIVLGKVQALIKAMPVDLEER